MNESIIIVILCIPITIAVIELIKVLREHTKLFPKQEGVKHNDI